MDKVFGGTPRGFQSLCKTCRNAQRMTGLNLQEVVFCQALARSPAITFPVETCSLYDDRRLPSLQRMQEIAWEVQSRNRGAVGFAGGRDMTIQIVPPSRPYPSDEPKPAAESPKENK